MALFVPVFLSVVCFLSTFGTVRTTRFKGDDAASRRVILGSGVVGILMAVAAAIFTPLLPGALVAIALSPWAAGGAALTIPLSAWEYPGQAVPS